jgi:hypothetical protein
MANNDNFARFQRLKGSENWEAWAIRMKALLAKEKLIIALTPMHGSPEPPSEPNEAAQERYEALISQYSAYVIEYQEKSPLAASYIQLALEDGPLYQTQHINGACELWTTLEGLYKPTGFTSEFLLANQLFSTTLASCNYKMEEYLTKIKRLTDQLASRNLTIPDGIVAAYTLSKLSNEYQSIVAVISQTYRQGGASAKIDLANLFSQLIDEEKRIKSRNVDTEMAMPVQTQGGNQGGQNPRSNRPKCSNCGRKGHKIENCWKLHPEKRPKDKAPTNSQPEEANIAQTDEETASEFAGFAATSGHESWILDSGATSHICGQREHF